jgi:putative acetyltransferase
MKIIVDDLQHPAVHELLNEHLQNMHQLSPAESVHALSLEELRVPEITLWTAWEDDLLLGCGALKELDLKHGEIKSMRTPQALRRRGVGRAMLAHIIEVAKERCYERLSLETGAQEGFEPARKLYENFGFTYCGRFGDYPEDPNSIYMTLRL